MSCWKSAAVENGHTPGFAGSFVSAGFWTPNNVEPVPVVPLPNSEGVVVAPLPKNEGVVVGPPPNNEVVVGPLPKAEVVVVVPLVVEVVGFVVFPKILPPLSGVGVGVDGFTPNKLVGFVPGAGAVEVVPPPKKPPPVALIPVPVPPNKLPPVPVLDGCNPPCCCGCCCCCC